ncbi:MAG: hypothetical protein L0Y66_00075 [Myxococcaceae bacterium]|nr:hypothetical protein [Myxococcaceae bacterium]MCI0670433.1 hypothetical protein [Myxococcaceae bacterium]
MRRAVRGVRNGVVAACVLLAPVLAHAQESSGGNGVKVGEGRLHPAADLELRYDSAAGFFDGPKLSPEMAWHLRPGLRYELPGRHLDVKAAGQLDLVWYPGWLTAASSRVSRVQGTADLSFIANQGGPLEVRVTDSFARTDRSSNLAIGFGVLSLGNRITLAVPVRPGAGALELTPEVGHGLETFSTLGATGCTDVACQPDPVAEFNYQNLHAGLDVRWRFLPKTAVVLDTDFDHRSFPQSSTPAASILRTTVGLSGLVTPRISLNVRLGWAQDTGAVPAGTVVGQAELVCPLTPFSLVRAGYLRTLDPAGSLGHYASDRLYADGRVLLGGRLSLSAAGGLDFVGYRGDAARRDRVGHLELTPEYQLNPWLRLGAGYLLGTRASSLDEASLNFARHEGYVRATGTY